MASVDRPNIRIEIQNNLIEKMDVDEESTSVCNEEEGEIIDTNDQEITEPDIITNNREISNRTWSNASGGFTTGVDIFDKKEQEKLQERAKRFGLKSDEIVNFTDNHLQKLYSSLGINVEDEKNIRFEAIHVRGTDEMSTDDIFEYFGKYGPAHIEWICDESCNVVWNDKISASRALHFISKPVKGMPVDGPCDPFTKDFNIDQESGKVENVQNNSGRSILLLTSDREVQINDEENPEDSQETENFVDISTINIPIPPGYWRLGIEHPKAKCILLRFAYKTDKKPFRAERFSEYYKNHGNPNFGGLKGLISESRRAKFKGIFHRNKDINMALIEDKKNPWGQLAENWNNDTKTEKEPQLYLNDVPVNDIPTEFPKSRLGVKRDHTPDVSSDESDKVKKVSKIPRMRMYADEEEEKLKQKNMKRELKQKQVNNDLRSILSIPNKKTENVFESSLHPVPRDLSDKLKNRIGPKQITYNSEEINRIEEVKNKIEFGKMRSDDKDLGKKRTLLITVNKQKESPFKHKKSKHERQMLRSDRSQRKLRNRSPFEESENRHKTLSKVAVVIRKQKKPTVASTIWSRITPKKERLKTLSEKLNQRQDTSSSESSSESESSSSSNNSSDSEPEDFSSSLKFLERPGFKIEPDETINVNDRKKSPLRIEISNDHFKRKD